MPSIPPPPTVHVSPDGCWLVPGQGTTRDGGHRQVGVGRSKVLAHLIWYRVLVGPVPKGLQLHHTCENPPCVNPAHLEPLTAAEHAARHAEGRTHCVHGHEVAVHGYRDAAGVLRCRPCRAATVAASKAKAHERQPMACACGWAGSGGELVNLYCPSCGKRAGRWGPQVVGA